ncbi:ParB/RepB/Spo0J family partition protein [uncultured Duncaniella sp.]|jgi:ParB family chromosome partitioning protein|uniref:ParB/RepB/Spo0J family partition protein n=2 Tax=uncultured Duncaniella sp. TaxID=2768039 RepID=UPI0025B0F73C|nr:ParB/RepB/Spo0J family partition protein [uncultured Duncaniella sp.]
MEATAIQTTANENINATANVQEAVIALSLIQPSGFNPRKQFDEQSLTELADSIRRQGVLQAIGVRPIADTDRYEIVYGERRYRASLIAERENIKAVVYDALSDKEAEELAVTENLQRQDITPMEEAEAYQRLINSGQHDVHSLAVQFGKSETYIRTRLKFNSLIPEIARLLETDEITVSVASEICRYGEEIQREVYDTHLKEGEHYNSWRGLSASKVAMLIERDFTTDLSRYSFDKTECAVCPHNTINLLLFSEDTEGKCANCPCLKAKHTDWLTATALNLLGEYPSANFCHTEYDVNEVVNARLTGIGHEVEALSGYPTNYPTEPHAPKRERYETEEEYAEALQEHEADIINHREKCDQLQAKADAGEITLYIRIGRNDVTLCYVAVPVKLREGSTEPEAEIAKLEEKDKRNKEISVEKTIEDTKKQILKADITQSKFTQDEDKMIYFFLLSSLREEHYEAMGLADRKSYYGLTDSEKMTVISNLNAQRKAIIRRDFLIDNFKNASRNNAIADLLLAFAKKHMPDELANIEAEYNEIYEKRHKRLEERIANLAEKIPHGASDETEPKEAAEQEEEPVTEDATSTVETDTETIPTEAEEVSTADIIEAEAETEHEPEQYEPTEEEAEAILTEEERHYEEAVA